MNYLLDTHYVLWALFSPEKIGSPVIRILQDNSSTKFVSGISLWEISLKYCLGKLELEDTNPDDIAQALMRSGFVMLDVDNHLFASYYRLPKKHDHKDPFDRMLVWQAIYYGYTLVSHDSRLDQYIPDGLTLV